MPDRADSRIGHHDGSLLAPGCIDEFLEGLPRGRGVDHEGGRGLRDQADQRDIGGADIGIAQGADDCNLDRRVSNRVSVRRLAGDKRKRQRTTRARLVLADDRDAEALLGQAAHHPRHGVRGASRGRLDDQLDLLGWIRPRLVSAPEEKCAGKRNPDEPRNDHQRRTIIAEKAGLPTALGPAAGGVAHLRRPRVVAGRYTGT